MAWPTTNPCALSDVCARRDDKFNALKKETTVTATTRTGVVANAKRLFSVWIGTGVTYGAGDKVSVICLYANQLVPLLLKALDAPGHDRVQFVGK